MLDNNSKWSHARGNTVVPSRWQVTLIGALEILPTSKVLAHLAPLRPLRGTTVYETVAESDLASVRQDRSGPKVRGCSIARHAQNGHWPRV
jgi:hypothetical protein